MVSIERPPLLNLIKEDALRELAEYQRQEGRRKRARPSVEEEKAMETLLAKLKEEEIEAEGKVGFITRLTTPAWNIVFIGPKNEKQAGTIISYVNPESIISPDGPVFSRKDIATINKLVVSPTGLGYDRFMNTARVIKYGEVSLPPSVKLSPVEVCEKELRKRISGPEVLSKPPNPEQNNLKKNTL